MKLLQRILFISVLISLSLSTYSQKRAFKKADAAFTAGEYFAASEIYEKIYANLKSKSEKASVSYKIGECYRKTNNPRGAKKWYRKAISGKYNNPLATLYYADALKMLEYYEQAEQQYQEYSEMVPADILGPQGVKSCKDAVAWMKSPTRHDVEIMDALKSKATDYSPAFGASTSEIYFSSTRENTTGTSTDKISGQKFSDIFYIKKDRKGKWSEAVPVEGGINTDFDEGSPCIINGGATMYYTSCKPGKSTGRCKIYKSRKSSDSWGDPQLVELFADSSISVAHPAVTKDELTIYFVCDTLEGSGGKDIWVAKRASATSRWSKPVNMGSKINTKNNEEFPFIRDNGELYFASNGHQGMGGLDIFKAKKEGKSWTITNMKYPINSSKDDFGICYYENQKRGCFTSTRERSDNIYYFELPDMIFSMKGVIKDSKTGEIIEGVEVKLVGSNGTNKEIISSSDGTFRFKLKKSTSYTITAFKKDFLKTKVEETTAGLKKSKVFSLEIELIPSTGDIELPNIEYDLGKSSLRPESFVSLDKLVNHLIVNSNITIELAANTDYRGSETSNQKLSQARAQSVVTYLISKGIKEDRLTPIGYGETKPKEIDATTSYKYDFLKEGDVLTEEFIKTLTAEQQEITNQMNRRTQFKVLRTDYGMNTVPFGG